MRRETILEPSRSKKAGGKDQSPWVVNQGILSGSQRNRHHDMNVIFRSKIAFFSSPISSTYDRRPFPLNLAEVHINVVISKLSIIIITTVGLVDAESIELRKVILVS